MSEHEVATRTLLEKGKAAAAAFSKRFEETPRWIVAAPGRINVIGEHVDYCEGLVLPMAIDRHVIMAAGPWSKNEARLFSVMAQEEVVVPLDRPIEQGPSTWGNYCRGVMRGFVDRGIVLPGFRVLIDSDLPMGGGLSSSAALEVAMATLLEAITRQRLPLVEKALLCQRAEHDYAGVPCGIMDQFASVYGRAGHLLLIDCRSQTVEPVALRDQSVTMLVINTNVRHELGTSEYPLRRARCEEAAGRLGLSSLRDATMEQVIRHEKDWPVPIFRSARHVVSEIARTTQTAQAFRQGDWGRAGDLMYASHASLRDDFEVSCAELDAVVEAALEIGNASGLYGCRMTGGGFGGCCIALIRTEQAARLTERLREGYARRTGQTATLFVTQPSEGAGKIEG